MQHRIAMSYKDSMKVYDKICDELNIINCGKDYKTLAGRMGYNVNEVKKFERHENPSDALLSHWGKKRGNTVIKLIEILKNMENDAAAEILEKARDNEAIKRSNRDGECSIDNPKKARPNKETLEGSGPSTSIVSVKAGSSSVNTYEHGELSSRGRSYEGNEMQSDNVGIKDLNSLVILQLCEKLDIEQKLGGDYKYLAAHFRMPNDHIMRISQEQNKTREVLNWIGRFPGNTVAKLRQILVNIQRDDCVDIINKKYC